MTERIEPTQPEYPSLEEFRAMSPNGRLQLWLGLPISAQKLLIGISAFVSDVSPSMAQPVSQTSEKEFEEAKRILLETPYFTQTETGRLDVAQPMREFIKTDLRRIWEEQNSTRKTDL
jgi:hypothetical protein